VGKKYDKGCAGSLYSRVVLLYFTLYGIRVGSEMLRTNGTKLGYEATLG